MIMWIAPGLHHLVRCIEVEEKEHKYDLGNQDIIGVAPGPSIEVLTDETSQFDDVPAAGWKKWVGISISIKILYLMINRSCTIISVLKSCAPAQPVMPVWKNVP